MATSAGASGVGLSQVDKSVQNLQDAVRTETGRKNSS